MHLERWIVVLVNVVCDGCEMLQFLVFRGSAAHTSQIYFYSTFLVHVLAHPSEYKRADDRKNCRDGYDNT